MEKNKNIEEKKEEIKSRKLKKIGRKNDKERIQQKSHVSKMSERRIKMATRNMQ